MDGPDTVRVSGSCPLSKSAAVRGSMSWVWAWRCDDDGAADSSQSADSRLGLIGHTRQPGPARVTA